MDAFLRQQLVSETGAALQHWCTSDMVWGLSDCALAVADIYRSALGYDPAASFRGRYKTQRGSLRVLGRGGLERAVSAAAAEFNWQCIDPPSAVPGDLALVRTPLGPACAIRYGNHWVGRQAYGFAGVEHDLVIAAWRVT